ncbi:MAG TPA: hypothetical protein VK533_13250 [Sphingomonas sp.]|uniref:hypothetical protein n=1 Tax=Sphingomonas sp. TaxID=28214 RepID=UPI002C462D2D|nr:hypothetical protein [Sphingomonas sp.]HMI20498.1 hypothetical protein [Sphingomonas sp.]
MPDDEFDNMFEDLTPSQLEELDRLDAEQISNSGKRAAPAGEEESARPAKRQRQADHSDDEYDNMLEDLTPSQLDELDQQAQQAASNNATNDAPLRGLAADQPEQVSGEVDRLSATGPSDAAEPDAKEGAAEPRRMPDGFKRFEDIPPPPPVLYQQFMGERDRYQDVLFLTKDGLSYVTAEQLRKTDPALLEGRLKEAGLPKTFCSTSDTSKADRPWLLVREKDESFTAVEALLPEAYGRNKRVIEAYPRKRIYALDKTSGGDVRYVNLTHCQPQYKDDFEPGKLELTKNQRMQLGEEVREYAAKTPTTRDHAKIVMGRILGTYDMQRQNGRALKHEEIAGHYPARPPLMAYGNDAIFTEELGLKRSQPPLNNASFNYFRDQTEDSKIYILDKPNIPRFGSDNPDAGRPEYVLMSTEQRLNMEALKQRHAEHVWNLGLGTPRWATHLSVEELFRLGISADDRRLLEGLDLDRCTSWGERLPEPSKAVIGVDGQSPRRHYVCTSTPPALVHERANEAGSLPAKGDEQPALAADGGLNERAREDRSRARSRSR